MITISEVKKLLPVCGPSKKLVLFLVPKPVAVDISLFEFTRIEYQYNSFVNKADDDSITIEFDKISIRIPKQKNIVKVIIEPSTSEFKIYKIGTKGLCQEGIALSDE